jgi:transcriptional regulator with XRE-family HTH domain
MLLPKKTLGGRLRWLRGQRDVTLREFASRIGCDPSYLSKLEAGRATKPTLRFLVSVSAAFRVSADWLRTGEGDPFGDLMSDAPTKESLSGWSSERVARVMAVLDDLQVALAPDRVLSLLLADKSLEGMRTFWNEVGGLGLPVTARLFWNDAFMNLQFQIMGREPREKRVLTDVTVTDNVSPVKSTMANLLERLNKATSQRGMKSKLAKVMGVPLPNISQWLSGEREPGGETTLKLLHWVEQQERKPSTLDSEINTVKGKTQLGKSSYEEPKPSPNR